MRADQLIDHERPAARDLARFVFEIRRIALAADASAGGRRPLAQMDAGTRTSITAAASAER